MTDYDGVIARHGEPSPAALSALQRLRASGRRIVLNTGRRMDELFEVCPQWVLFDSIVAENGAVHWESSSGRQTLLATPPPAEFAARLRRRRVSPLDCGRVIVATRKPHEAAVADTIQEMSLKLQIIFNRAAVMVLPAGTDKAAGMEHALHRLGLSREQAVGVGDSENDHAFLKSCRFAATVANAIPAVRKTADWVARGAYGVGLTEIIDELIANDLQAHEPHRHDQSAV